MIKVVELFAGVGGFRLGLEGDVNGNSASSNYTKPLNSNYKVVWSNQYEPSTPTTQHANLVYEHIWGSSHHNGHDINLSAGIDMDDKTVQKHIPKHDLLCGGFPCQDYSVAGVNTDGIKGKKGVLWWNIYKILCARRPKFVFLENVDRLLKSPTNMRGRDFAIMLKTLTELGYIVEWKVINAADYGMPQRRRRVFIMAYHKKSNIDIKNFQDWILKSGVLAKSFPGTKKGEFKQYVLKQNVKSISKNFQKGKFLNSGIIDLDHNITTVDYNPSSLTQDILKTYSKFHVLGDVVSTTKSKDIPPEFIVDDVKQLKKPIFKKQQAGAILSYLKTNDNDFVIMNTELEKWKYLKGKKREERKSSQGIFYYNEGPMSLLDDLDKPSRTVITSEGGPGASRFKHLIKFQKKTYRRLLPYELELLNMFPKHHTQLKGISDSRRAFFMGNALVVGVVEKIGKELTNMIS